MGFILAGLIGTAVAAAILVASNSPSIVRYLIACIVAVSVTAILTVIIFQIAHPFNSASWRAMYTTYVAGGILAAVMSPVIGIAAASLWRRRKST